MAQKREIFHLNRDIEHSIGFSQAVRAGNLLFVSGTVSVNETFEPIETGNIAGQYRVIYDKLKKTLEAYGLAFGDVVKENIFTEDLPAFFDSGNAIRMEYYDGLDYYPAATAVESPRIAFEGNLVEIELIAVFPH